MSENRISITRTGENTFLLENRTEYHFRDRFFLAWFLECDGIVIDKGEIAPVRAAAGGEFAFTFTHELPEEGVSSLLLSVVTAVDSEIAPRDREVYCAQFILKDVPPPF
ncbi:MAG: hypothetical protein IKL89_02100, partial [Clostridia bacterium]|nr:hypothetical protein [Clostridia bacterium]